MLAGRVAQLAVTAEDKRQAREALLGRWPARPTAGRLERWRTRWSS